MTVNIVLILITMYFLKTSTVSTELVLTTRVNYGLSLKSSQAYQIRGSCDAHAAAGTYPPANGYALPSMALGLTHYT